MNHAGIDPMSKLRLISVLMGVWLLPWCTAQASIVASQQTALPQLCTHIGFETDLDAAGALRNSKRSDRTPLPQSPIIQTRPKQVFRVLEHLNLAIDGIGCERCIVPNGERARGNFSHIPCGTAERHIFFCRLLL